MKNNSKNDEKGQKVYYGQVPLRLLRDPAICPQAKALYGILHTHCPIKDLASRPRTMIPEIMLAYESGVTTTTLRSWLKILKKHSWISIKRKGIGRPNEYTLLTKCDLQVSPQKEKYRKFSEGRQSEADEGEKQPGSPEAGL